MYTIKGINYFIGFVLFAIVCITLTDNLSADINLITPVLISFFGLLYCSNKWRIIKVNKE